MRFLRNNTAQRVTVGPFMDPTDGVTPKLALTVTASKLTFTADVANVPTLVLDTNPTVAGGGPNDMVHMAGDDSGLYDLELAAADVNYFGRALLALTNAAAHCPVWHEFMILPGPVYDALVLGIGRLDANTTHVGGTVQTAGDLAGSLATIISAMATIAGYIDTEVAAIKAKTDNLPANPAAVSDIPSQAAIVAAVFAKLFRAAYGGVSFESIVEFIASQVGAPTTGAGTGAETFKTLDGSASKSIVTNDGTNRTGTTIL